MLGTVSITGEETPQCMRMPGDAGYQDALIRFDNARCRLQNPEPFFREELNYIKQRRQKLNAGDRRYRSALALSGGGIRSNAFQLGILSGLHKKENTVRFIDYISSVSGGSWAHMSYKANVIKKEELVNLHPALRANCLQSKENQSILSDACFFELIDHFIYLEDSQLKRDIEIACADFREPAFQNCPIYLRPLMRSYDSMYNKLDQLYKDSDQLSTIREEWRRMIQWHTLFSGDRKLSELHAHSRGRDASNLIKNRPFSIFNTTHDAKIYFIQKGGLLGFFKPALRGFPFEFTAFALGTSVDHGSKLPERCVPYSCLNPGPDFIQHLIRPAHLKGAYYTFRNGARYLPAETPSEAIMLSHVAAMSSAVAPDINISLIGADIVDLPGLEWYYNFPGSKKRTGYPYTITDGGHSDNLGMLSLMERKVDFIITSDAGQDEGLALGDLEVLKYQAKKLFDIEVKERTRPELIRYYNNTMMFNVIYRVRGEDRSTARDRVILYIKPKSTPGFKKHLSKHYPEVYNILRFNVNKFPQDATFVKSYHMTLIQAYYLLGRYVAKRCLGRHLQYWNRNPARYLAIMSRKNNHVRLCEL